MYTVGLNLSTTTEDNCFANRCFFAVNKLHNVLISHCKDLLDQLNQDPEYQAWRTEYGEINSKNENTKQEKIRLKELGNLMNTRREEIGLTESALQSYEKVWRKRYTKLVSSNQAQKEATRVWKSVEAYLFGDGKEIHYRKISDMHTIGGKSNTNGVKFDPATLHINWLGHDIKCKVKLKDPYIREALGYQEQDGKYVQTKPLDISYCEIERKAFKNGWHYYVIIYIKGDAPKKDRKLGQGNMGIDPGISTLAASADDAVFLEELAPNSINYDKEIAKVQRQMDASKRALNPDNYDADGKVKKGRKTWVYSKHYYKLRWKLRDLFRRKSAYIQQCHNELANKLLPTAETFFVEKNNFSAMAKRSKKEAERSEKTTAVINKAGEVKEVRLFKKKKRFGRSVNRRAPALLLRILKQKVKLLGGQYIEISPFEYKASQYCHDTGECVKVPLSQRSKTIVGETVQRDLYSSFLLAHPNEDLTKPDQSACSKAFPRFCQLQNETLSAMKQANISMKQCFGF